MGQVMVFALVASSALVVGASVGARWAPPERSLAALLGLASGSLTSAMSFELFDESFMQGGPVFSGLGFATGAVVFILVDVLLQRRGNMRSESAPGSLLLAAAVLDGVPENVALGTTLAAGGGSVALLGAIFVSNFPEALVGARSMCDSGRSVTFALGTWYVAAVVLALAIIAGSSLLKDLPEQGLSVVLAFAGGAVLASLATTLFPKAYADGGPWVALSTVAGFLLAFALGSVGS